jgi:hypothetical protein
MIYDEHNVAIAYGYSKITERPIAAAVHANVRLMHATMTIYTAFCSTMSPSFSWGLPVL